MLPLNFCCAAYGAEPSSPSALSLLPQNLFPTASNDHLGMEAIVGRIQEALRQASANNLTTRFATAQDSARVLRDHLAHNDAATVFFPKCGNGELVLAARAAGAKRAYGLEDKEYAMVSGPRFNTARENMNISPHTAAIGFVNIIGMSSLPHMPTAVFSASRLMTPLDHDLVRNMVRDAPNISLYARRSGTDQSIDSELSILNEGCDHSQAMWRIKDRIPVKEIRGNADFWVYEKADDAESIRHRNRRSRPVDSMDFESDILVSMAERYGEEMMRKQFSQAATKGGFIQDDLLALGRALVQNDVKQTKVMSSADPGSFGFMVQGRYRGTDVVIKISNTIIPDTSLSQQVMKKHENNSLLREGAARALVNAHLTRNAKDNGIFVNKPVNCFKGTSSAAMIVLGPGRSVFALASERGLGSCSERSRKIREEFVRTGTLEDKARAMFSGAANNLAFLNSAGVTHRDFKMANVIVLDSDHDKVAIIDEGGAHFHNMKYCEDPDREKQKRVALAEVRNTRKHASQSMKRARIVLVSAMEGSGTGISGAGDNSELFRPCNSSSVKPITDAMLQKFLTNENVVYAFGGSGTIGSRAHEVVKIKKQRQNDGKQICVPRKPDPGAKEDTFSFGSAVIQTMVDMYDFSDVQANGRVSKGPLAFENALHKIGSIQNIVLRKQALSEMLLAKVQTKENLQEDSFTNLVEMLSQSISSNPEERPSMDAVSRSDYFLNPILPTDCWKQVNSDQGLLFPGGTKMVRGQETTVQDLVMKKTPKRGNSIFAAATSTFEKHEIVTFYAGIPSVGGPNKKSKYVVGLKPTGMYADGMTNSKLSFETLKIKLAAGGFLNSCRTEATVKAPSLANCYLDYEQKFQDEDGLWLVPVKALKAISAGDELVWDYDFQSGPFGAGAELQAGVIKNSNSKYVALLS